MVLEEQCVHLYFHFKAGVCFDVDINDLCVCVCVCVCVWSDLNPDPGGPPERGPDEPDRGQDALHPGVAVPA